jgi:hypothetical protein
VLSFQPCAQSLRNGLIGELYEAILYEEKTVIIWASIGERDWARDYI